MIDVGSVSVAPNATYTATGLAKFLFEFRYIELVGSLTAPPVPPATPAPVFGAFLAAIQDAAQAAKRDAFAIANGMSVGANSLPNKSSTTPAGGGLAFQLTQAAGIMTGGPSVVFDASTQTMTRSAGSWLTDGFLVRQSVLIIGSLLNDDFADAITGVTATILSFASGIVTETVTTPRFIVQAGLTRLGAVGRTDFGGLI
jgi:hypothetical protein